MHACTHQHDSLIRGIRLVTVTAVKSGINFRYDHQIYITFKHSSNHKCGGKTRRTSSLTGSICARNRARRLSRGYV